MADQNDKNKKSILSEYFSEAEIQNMDKKLRASIEKQLKSLSKLDEFAKRQKSIWESITQSFLNLNISDFQTKIKISSQDIAKISAELTNQEESIRDISATLKDNFSQAISGVRGDLLSLSSTSADISSDMHNSLMEAVKSGKIGDFLKEQGSVGKKALQNLIADKDGFDALKQFLDSDAVKGFEKIIVKTKQFQAQLDQNGKTVFDLQKSLINIGDQLTKAFAMDKVKASLMDFDNTINHTQRDFGIEMDNNVGKFSELNTQSARFGMTAKENAQFMGALGEGIQNTNYDLLAGAAKDMMAVQQATGLAAEGVTELTKQMMFYGASSKDVASFTEDTMNKSLKAGLSTKKILTEFTKMIPNAKALGWAGGAKELREMVIQAEKLGQNIEGIAASSKKLRTLESGLEAAADLALMGVNVNALQLIGAARRGGKEFSSMLADMTKGIGHLEKGTNEIEFSGLDVDRLQGIADATGQTVEDLQKQITKSIQVNAKNKLLPSSFFNLDKDQKQFLMDATRLNDKGEIELSGAIMGVTDLKKVSPEMIKAAMAQTKTLEDYAEKNKSFEDSVTGLKSSIMYMTTFLQPVIAWVTKLIQGFNEWFSKSNLLVKSVVAGVAVFGAMFFSVAKNFYNGYTMGLGFNAATTKGGFLKSLGGILNPMNWKKQLFGGAATVATKNQVGGFGAGLGNADKAEAEKVSKLSQALKAMPSPQQLLALSVALVALGLAFVGIGEGIKLAAEGLATLTQSFNNISNAGEALGAVSVVMGSFVGMLAIMIPLVGALAAEGTAGAIGLLALGASFTMIGFGIKLAADGLANLVKSFNNISNAGAALGAVAITMYSFIGALALMIPLVGVLGAEGTAGAIGLLALGASFTMIGFGIKLAADGLASLVGALNNAGANIIPFARAITQAAIPAVMFTGAIYAMVPAITALSLVGTLGALGISALGGAFMMLGLGSTLATTGLSKLSGVFAETNSKLIPFVETVSKAAVPMLMFSGGLYAMIPALVALGGTGILTSVGIMAVGAAIGYLGSGLKKSGEGLSLITKSFGDLSGVLDSLKNIGWGTLDTLSASLGKLSPSFNNIQSSLGESVSSLLSGIQSFAPQLKQIGSSISEQIGLLFAGFNDVLPGLDKIQIGIGNKINNIVNLFNSIVTSLNSVQGRISETMNLISSAFNNVSINFGFIDKINSLQGNFLQLAPILQGVGRDVSQAMTNISFAFEKLSPILQDVGRDVSQSMTNISSAFEKLSPGLEVIKSISKAFGDLSVGALITVSKAIDTVAIGFSKLSTVSWEALQNFGQNVTQIIPAIKKFAGLSDSTTSITSTAVALGMLAGALHIAGRGLMSIQNINWNTLGSIEAPLKSFIHGIGQIGNIDVTVSGLNQLGAIGPMIYVGASAIMALGAAIGQVQWDKFSLMGTSLDNAIPSLSAFGKTGFFAAPGIMIMNSVLGSLANTMNNLSPALDKASVSMLGLSQGVERLKIASSGLDTSNLNNLTEISNKLLNVPIAAPVAAPPTQTRSNSPQLTPIKIIVDHRTNGRDTYQEIVEAHTYSS